MTLSTQNIPTAPSKSQTSKEVTRLLPTIATMQQYLNRVENSDWALKSAFLTSPLKLLNTAVDNLPAYDAYQVGRELGIREFRIFCWSFSDKHGRSLDLSWEKILEKWWIHAYLSEYGEINLEQIEQQCNYFFVTFMNTKISTSNATINKPACPLIAGILAGFFSSLFGVEIEAVEPECHEVGNQNCTFILGSALYINPVQFWQTVHNMK